jgi:NAD(P)-dependent dehydrogenase (short-subunit alcohol dehydrogenase family)
METVNTENGVCIVVGVGPGMGLALVRRFAREGFKVAMVARRQDALAEYEKSLAAQGYVTKGFVADATMPALLLRALDEVQQTWGPPQVLIYNTSILNEGMPTTLNAAGLVNDFKVNVVGAQVAAQFAAQSMRTAKKGTILITGGGLALQPYAMMASLAIGKAGVRSLAHSLAQELEPAGIHVATVTIQGMIKAGTKFDPDAIAEEFWQLHLESPGQFQREIFFK